MAKFQIHFSTAWNKWCVIENTKRKMTTVLRCDTQEEAQEYVQRCLMQDRDFAMEGR